MKKIKTLKKNYEFSNVLSKGKCIRGKYVNTYIIKNKKNENYIGIAVSVKIGKAVKRNYIKRKIRSVYIKYRELLNIGYNIVFLFKKSSNIDEVNYKDIEKDIEKAFKIENILNE